MASIGVGLLGLWLLLPGGTPESQEANRQRARAELAEGTRLFSAREYAAAEKRFARSLELDPAQPAVPYLIARAIHAQYRPGDRTRENLDRVRKAIAAYHVVLAADPNQEEAWQAVALLYGEIGEESRQREWILRRAANVSVPVPKRVEAYLTLAARDWTCTQKTEEGRAAGACAARGLETAEKGLQLDPESEAAWSHKANLLAALARLAEARGAAAEKADYEERAEQAQKRAEELREKQRQESEAVRAY